MRTIDEIEADYAAAGLTLDQKHKAEVRASEDQRLATDRWARAQREIILAQMERERLRGELWIAHMDQARRKMEGQTDEDD